MIRATCLASGTRLIALVLLTVLAGAAPRDGKTKAGAAPKLPTYDARFYVIHSDLEPDQVREVRLRVDAMATEYAQRTRGFSGQLNVRFPLFVFRTEAAYLAAGGMAGSAGQFDGSKLMAVAGEQPSDETWHTIQHEGFHQFAGAVIRGELPMWVNEGLAEYFGESVWCGDEMISGIVPHGRLARVKRAIERERLPTIERMFSMSNADWNGNLKIENYDMAWSMCHFLAHGENGRFQKPFAAFIGQLSKGQQPEKAWQATFRSMAGFEEAYRTYWRTMPGDPTIDLFAQATTSKMTSLLGRASAQGQSFADVDALLAEAKAGSLKSHPEDWLPPSIAESMVEDHAQLAKRKFTWQLKSQDKRPPTIVCTTPEGATIVGTFKTNGKRIGAVSVGPQKLPATPASKF